MYQRLQGYARAHSPGASGELRQYHQDYRRDVHHFRRLSTKRELIEEALEAPLVIVGDYHTLPQAQRTLVRIVRACLPLLRGKKIILALEWLRPEDTITVGRYLRSQISEDRFLREVCFFERWGFDWHNYRPLFEFAKTHGLCIVGLAKLGERNLKARDRSAAQQLANLRRLEPDSHIFVLIGDLHLATSHLPAELKRKLPGTPVVTVHQNIDNFYWALVEKGLEHTIDVVEIRPHTFCVLNTPPWLKLQSHLKWLEVTDSQRNINNRSLTDAFSEIDFSPDIVHIVRHLQSFLGIPKLPVGTDFQVVGPSDFRPNRKKSVTTLINSFESFSLPEENTIFLSNLSANQLASQTTILFHSRLSGLVTPFLNPRRDFYTYVWIEALGFLGSKIINPKRKCNGPQDLEKIAEERSVRPLHREFVITPNVAEWSLAALKREPRLADRLPSTANPERLVFYYKCAKILGHLLGQGLYQGVVLRKISRNELRRLFLTPLTDPKLLYRRWTNRLDAHELREQSKNDTF